MSFFKNFLFIVLIFFILVNAYFIYEFLPKEKEDFKIYRQEELPEVSNVSSEVMQFIPNMRFTKNNLSYSFQDGCSVDRREGMIEAFFIISERVENLDFFKKNDDFLEADILIKCSEEDKRVDDEERQLFIAGEGGPTKYLDLSPYALIIQGEVQLYSSKNVRICDEPLVEIHELLHVLGFAHVGDKESILYPYLSCDQKLKENIILVIEELYSEEPKSEIFISNLSASKSGRYLDFYVEIKNSGLVNAEEVILKINSQDRNLHELEIEDIEPDMTRIIESKNVLLPSTKIDKLIFSVSTITEEYFYKNNKVELVVQ
jgi:hypothetical protein